MHTPNTLEAMPVDEDFADLIESAYLQGLINGEMQELAYLWLEVNHPCEQ